MPPGHPQFTTVLSATGRYPVGSPEAQSVVPVNPVGQDSSVLCLQIMVQGERWAEAVELAETLSAKACDRTVYVLGAEAMRHTRPVAEAKEYLLRVETGSGVDAAYQFLMARLEALAGQITKAECHLAMAFRLSPPLRSAARREPDLAPVWQQMQT